MGEQKRNGGQFDTYEKPELSEAQVEEMQEWFQFFDKNGDGKLDLSELCKVFRAMCWDLTDAEMEEVYTNADSDKNGYIDYDEYMKLLESYRKDPYIEKVELMEAFRLFDKDRSGFLDVNELERYFLTRDVDHKHMKKMFQDADKNGDGKINIEEFVELMMTKP